MERIHILDAINKALPEGLEIKSIRFILAEGNITRHSTDTRALSIKADFCSAIPPGIEKEADEITKDIKDEKLRIRLKRAYLAYKQRKRT